MEAAIADHPLLKGLNLSAIPPILGYNVVQPAEGGQVVIRWQDWGDPAVAVGQFGRGRVLAYMSDPAPHWGCNFVYCDQYNVFWHNACRWLLTGE